MPGQVAASSSARTLPVRRNRPGRKSPSTARLTAPSTSGTDCHSSRRTGSAMAPSAASGSALKATASGSRSSRTTVRAILRAVVVLPVALGPVRRIAGSSEKRSESVRSTSLGMYAAVTWIRIPLWPGLQCCFSPDFDAVLGQISRGDSSSSRFGGEPTCTPDSSERVSLTISWCRRNRRQRAQLDPSGRRTPRKSYQPPRLPGLRAGSPTKPASKAARAAVGAPIDRIRVRTTTILVRDRV